MSAKPDIAVTDATEEERYEIRVDGELAGFAQYRRRPGAVSLTHTEIDDRFEGRGLGGKLVAFALDDLRAQGLGVLPFCPFVKSCIQRHPEYLDLVPEGRRAEFELQPNG